MAIDDTTEPDTDIYDVDAETKPAAVPQPLYQVYEGSKIAVSKQVGKFWKNRYDAAIKAYEEIRNVWEEVYRYYNHSQGKTQQTPRGLFKRGDSSENIIFSNLNIMLPAIYSRDPDVSCTTNDKQDEPFTQCLEAVLNALFKRKDLLNAKPKIKKAAGVGLLTNYGVLKIDWVKKDDSLELAAQEMQRISAELRDAKDQATVEELYGELEALEMGMEVLEPSGPKMRNVLPHNLIIDPNAEQPDGSDAAWMIEKTFLPTAGLKARFTKKETEDDEETKNVPRVLLYKPTHKAVFSEGASGDRDDGLGLVMRALDGKGDAPVSFEEEGRRAYVNMYFTECYYVWDKALRRVMLFHRDDWTWPLWVWDDPLGITRFFPYFLVNYTMNTGGTVGVGETAYLLDQQDEVNDINRQMARMRRTVFDFFFFNSDQITPDEAEKFIDALRGVTQGGKHLLGVKAGEGGDINKLISAFVPPQLQYEQLFNKPSILDTVNRISNTSDALRGVQFKTNTNVASATLYQESMKLSVGAKVDILEDTVADLALAMAELSVQNYDQIKVTALVGADLGGAWEQMTVDAFRAKYSVNIVSGSMEKPNSTFRKKEAIEVAQAVGQFARAAPGAVVKIMLRVLEQAFTEVVIKKEDWDALDAEVTANMQKGMAQPGQPGAPSQAQQGGQPPGAQPGGGQQGGELEQAAHALPPEDKQKIVQMSQQGAPPQSILKFIQQRTGASNA